MKLLTIVQPSRPGLLAEITTLLGKHNIDVRDIDGQTAEETAIITLSVEPYSEAFTLLADAGYRVVAARHLLVRIEDRPGELARLSRTLSNEGVDIRSIHIVCKEAGSCIVALETGAAERAREILRDLLV